MQVAAGIAPHVHDGAIEFGTRLPAPLHTYGHDVPTEGDDLDLLATPPSEPVHTPCLEPAAPKVSQRVQDVMACKAVTLVARASRRRTAKQAPAMGPRLIFILCWLTEFGDSQFVRCHAAGWLATVHFALRLINGLTHSAHVSLA